MAANPKIALIALLLGVSTLGSAEWIVNQQPASQAQVPRPLTLRRNQLRNLLPTAYTSRSGEPVFVLRSSGRDTLIRSADSVVLRPGEFVAARVRDSVRLDTVGPQVRFDLPFRIVGSDSNGSTVSLRPAVQVEGGGLRYSPADETFQGSLLVGLEDSLQPTESRALGAAIQVQVSADDADSVSPRVLTISHTNVPFERVRLFAATPGESVEVHLVPVFNPSGVHVVLRVNRPPLTLRASPKVIQGLGLETAVLSVAVAPGIVRASRVPIVVTLSSDRASPEPGQVRVDSGGVGHGQVRSRWVGEATIRAEHPQLKLAEVQLQFEWPLLFLLLAIVGSLVGTIWRWLRKPERTSRSFWFHVLGGLIAGLGWAVLWSLGLLQGLDLPLPVTYSEIGVVAVAALGSAGVIKLSELRRAPKAQR